MIGLGSDKKNIISSENNGCQVRHPVLGPIAILVASKPIAKEEEVTAQKIWEYLQSFFVASSPKNLSQDKTKFCLHPLYLTSKFYQTFKLRCWRATTTTWKKPPTGTGRSIREHWRQTGEKKGIWTKQWCAQKLQDDGSTYFRGHQIDHFEIFKNAWDGEKRKLDSKCTFDCQISQTKNCSGFTVWV